MNYKIRYIAQLCNEDTDEILEEQLIQTKSLQFPKSFQEFGLRHAEQIALIKKSQDFTLKYQVEYFNQSECPNCKKKLRKQGQITSDFHDILTDHKIQIQRLTCTCGWKNKNTLNGIYGNACHPELLEQQAKMGANTSFEKASQILNGFSAEKRNINNDVTIMRNVTKVGSSLDAYKKSKSWAEPEEAASELVVVTDGGHVQDKSDGKHTFEELISTVYSPEDITYKKDGGQVIDGKLSVGSAKSDQLRSIQQLTLNACKHLGMTKDTSVTALTDGAQNCWSVINNLGSSCKQLIRILDWFHIGKKFKERESKVPEELKEIYDKAKWHCWHGHPKTSVIRLTEVRHGLESALAIEKVDELITYINNNSLYIINYHARRLKGLPFSSQLAESSVNSIINEPQKNKKMQWTREGAHNILQIRTSLFSKRWKEDWQNISNDIYKTAA